MNGIHKFFWYDFETQGLDARRDRPVLFSGLQTDGYLRQTAPLVEIYCRPTPDTLPSVEACMVHGISPQMAQGLGVTEHEFATETHRWVAQGNTCVVGYNAERFDHIMMRFLFYRNLIDPYAWHWRDGNFKWDVIDLMRAVYVFHPQSLEWQYMEEDGRRCPSFRLADLSTVNGISHWAPHRAPSDVQATLGMARLVYERCPELFAEYLGMADHRVVGDAVAGTFLHVSARLQHRPGGGSILAPLHIDDRMGYIYAFDLSVDPDPLLFRNSSEHLLASDSQDSLALHWIKGKASPFVRHFDIEGALSPEQRSILERLDLDLQTLQRHHQILQKDPFFGSQIRDAFESRWPDIEEDVDAALYGAFIPSEDRHILNYILQNTDNPGPHWEQAGFEDPRLPEFVFRFRARNFPESLSLRDKARWKYHCRFQVFERKDQEGLTSFQRFTYDLAHTREKYPEHKDFLDDLEYYASDLRQRL